MSILTLIQFIQFIRKHWQLGMIAGFSLVLFISTLYILHLKAELLDRDYIIQDLKTQNTALAMSNEALSTSIDNQNQAITELNQLLQDKETKLSETVKELSEKYEGKIKELETEYNQIELNDAQEAITWLKTRKFAY